VSGEWAGDYVSDRPGGGCLNAGGGFVMNLVQQRTAGDVADQAGTLTSAFAGTLAMDNVLVPAVQRALTLTFDVTGTIGTPPDPNDGAPFVLIGLQPPPDPEFQSGIIAVLIGLRQPGPGGVPGAIAGDYALFGSFADVFSAIWRGAVSSFDSGGFKVERQPGPNGH